VLFGLPLPPGQLDVFFLAPISALSATDNGLHACRICAGRRCCGPNALALDPPVTLVARPAAWRRWRTGHGFEHTALTTCWDDDICCSPRHVVKFTAVTRSSVLTRNTSAALRHHFNQLLTARLRTEDADLITSGTCFTFAAGACGSRDARAAHLKRAVYSASPLR